MNAHDVDILARTIYGEARGEYERWGMAPLMAVGNVVMNRLHNQSWYGRTISEICQKPLQFSCWNRQDPNRPLLMQSHVKDPLFLVCQEVATHVAMQKWPDITKGSDHYHASTIPLVPPWTKGQRPTIWVGNHVFYRLKKGD